MGCIRELVYRELMRVNFSGAFIKVLRMLCPQVSKNSDTESLTKGIAHLSLPLCEKTPARTLPINLSYHTYLEISSSGTLGTMGVTVL